MGHRDTQKEDDHVKTRQKLERSIYKSRNPKDGTTSSQQSKEGFLPRGFRENVSPLTPSFHTLVFKTSQISFYCFKPPSLESFITTDQGDTMHHVDNFLVTTGPPGA